MSSETKQLLPTLDFAFWLRILLVVGITLALVFALITVVGGGGEVAYKLLDIDISWAFLALLLSIVNLLVSPFRWGMFLRGIDAKVPYVILWQAVLASWPLAVITPSRAGDLFRAWCLRDRINIWAGSGTVLSEKVIDFLSICLLMTICGANLHMLSYMYWGAALFAVSCLMIICAITFSSFLKKKGLLPRLVVKSEQVLSSLAVMSKKPILLVFVIGLSLLAWMNSCLIILVLLKAFGLDLPFWIVAVSWFGSVLISMVPITMAGMGLRDAGFLAILYSAGVKLESSSGVLCATLTYSLLTTWVYVLFGIMPLLRKLDEKKPHAAHTPS